MKKYNKIKILKLRKQGLTIRDIQKELNISSPSVVQYYLDHETTREQIDRLANFIMSEIPGEPSESEGAIDTAIRLLKTTLVNVSKIECKCEPLKGGGVNCHGCQIHTVYVDPVILRQINVGQSGVGDQTNTFPKKEGIE